MEELRSSDVLDKEIRSDSVKKAEKILAKADENAKALLESVNERVAKAKADAEKVSEEQIALYKKNVNAAGPLEKQRYLVSYIHNSLVEAMNKYFEEIGKEKRLLIIKKLAERAKPCILDKEISATVIGADLKASEKMLKELFGKNVTSVETGSENLIIEEVVQGFNKREGILLKTNDSSVLCRITLDEKIKELLSEKSCELAETLFGGRIPE